MIQEVIQMNKKNKMQVASVVLIVLSFLIAVYFHPQMPEEMASHWNARGEVDDYMDKTVALFLFPAVMVFLYLFFLVIPIIDPLKKNIEKFRKYYNLLILVLMLFMFYMHSVVIAWNLGYRYNMNLLVLPAVAVLLYFAGVVTENAKRNWFVGIRTPWTLSSDVVWKKTNKIGGLVLKLLAVYMLVLLLLADLATGVLILLLIAPIILVVFGLFAYSYWLYTKVEK